MREDVRSEVDRIVSDGYREVILSGVNLGEYRDAVDTRFVDVLRMIVEDAPPFRLRISSIEPNTVTTELIDVIAASSSIVPHLHIPLQSGSAVVSILARRGNDRESSISSATRGRTVSLCTIRRIGSNSSRSKLASPRARNSRSVAIVNRVCCGSTRAYAYHEAVHPRMTLSA